MNPPRLATALLTRLGPHDDALAGDLREAYLAGKSRQWYWRQVISALIETGLHDVRTHPFVALRGMVLTWAFVWVWMNYLLFIFLNFDQWLFETGLQQWFYVNGYHIPVWLHGFPAFALWKALIYAASGWLLARTTPRECASMVFAYAAFILAANVIYVSQQLAMPDRYYTLAQLIADLIILYPAAAFAGGLWGASKGVSSARIRA